MNQSALVVTDALLEREHEVGRIGSAVRGVGQQAGVAVVIGGAAGMGKSRPWSAARAPSSLGSASDPEPATARARTR